MVKVFALSTCPYCRMTRAYLDENDVTYDVVEVDLLEGDDREVAISQVKELSGGTSFPVVIVGDEIIVGFNKKRIQEVLDL